MKCMLIIPLFAVLACGSIGTVDRQAAAGLFDRVSTRVVDYVAASQQPDDPVLLDIQVAAQAIAGPDDRIQTGPIRALVESVCQAHDRFVTADSTLTDLQRRTYLRSTQLLRALMDESAAKATSRPIGGD